MKQVLVIRADLNMGKGKMVAQGSHASIESFLLTKSKKPEWATMWLAEGQKKIVLKAESRESLIELHQHIKNLLPSVLISDAGHTQVEPGTITALGIGPAPEPELDKFIANFKLL